MNQSHLISDYKYIKDSFNLSIETYVNEYKSLHWQYFYNKKNNLLNEQKIIEFRKNEFSQGLDDKSKSLEGLKNFYTELTRKTGLDYLESLLDTNNIGNNEHYFKYKNFFVDLNLLHNINFFYEIEKNISLNDDMIICEIGGGYGHLAKLLLSKFKVKIILIDLPETNLMSSYFLMENFKNHKFLLYSKVKSNNINIETIKDYDVIVIPPWAKIGNLKIDLFINIRSMMEMNFETIKKYFNLIQDNIKINGYLININRYLKSTVGHDIKLGEYPYDDNWDVMLSKQSEFQNRIHQLFTKRCNENKKSISNELKSINEFTKNNL